jgi:hypothetical protein
MSTTYSPNIYPIGSCEVTPSTSSSPLPFEVGRLDYFDERFHKPFDEPTYNNQNLLTVPASALGTYPNMELDSLWVPKGLPQRIMYPTPPEQDSFDLDGSDESYLCPEIDMSRDWQNFTTNLNEFPGTAGNKSLEVWGNRCISITPDEVEAEEYLSASPSTSSPKDQPSSIYGGLRASTSPKLRTAQMQRKVSTDTTGSCPNSKATHNEVEKNYRNRLNNHFKQLLSKIPAELLDSNGIDSSAGQKNVTKADTLVLATQYIKVLREQERELSARNQQLMLEFERLKEQWVGIGGMMMP